MIQTDVASALAEAANLLVVGMLVVFLFLSLLIGAICLISWLNQLWPEPTGATDSVAQPANPSSGSPAVPKNVVAAISAAISQHRQSH
ncbi:OadG family protein [Paraglaciecola aestuariivivens]